MACIHVYENDVFDSQQRGLRILGESWQVYMYICMVGHSIYNSFNYGPLQFIIVMLS